MDGANFQRHAREAFTDIPLRRGGAERALQELLARLTPAPGDPRRWKTNSLRTGHHLIAFVCRHENGKKILVRIAWSKVGAEALEQERHALRALREVAGLTAWQTLVPTILDEGTVSGREYLVETVMPGVDGRTFTGVEHRAAVQALARAIAPLYLATSRELGPGESPPDLLAPLGPLSAACGSGARDAVERLRDRLASALADHRLSFARVHGDLWLGNALLGREGAQVTGIVDWASSRATGLPAVDLAHLEMTSRAIASRRDNGLMVQRLLDAREPLEPSEHNLLLEHGGAAAQLLRTDDLFLLAWLQHVGHVLSGAKVWIPRLWLKRNVDPVLATL